MEFSVAKELNWIFIGNLNFSAEIISHAAQNGFLPKLVIGSELKNHEKNALLLEQCQRFKVPYSTQPIEAHINQIKHSDFLFVHRYGIIKPHIFESPRIGTFNLHFSKLPEYRGIHPVSWAIINGEKSTGVTVHKIDYGIDTGDIILQRDVEITDDDDIWTLTKKMEISSLEIMEDFFKLLTRENITSIAKKQPTSCTNFYARRRTPKDGQVFWKTMPARDIFNLTRALKSPLPNAFCTLGEKIINISESKLIGTFSPIESPPGEVLEHYNKKTYLVQAIKGEQILITTSENLIVGDVLV